MPRCDRRPPSRSAPSLTVLKKHVIAADDFINDALEASYRQSIDSARISEQSPRHVINFPPLPPAASGEPVHKSSLASRSLQRLSRGRFTHTPVGLRGERGGGSCPALPPLGTTAAVMQARLRLRRRRRHQGRSHLRTSPRFAWRLRPSAWASPTRLPPGQSGTFPPTYCLHLTIAPSPPSSISGLWLHPDASRCRPTCCSREACRW